MTLPASFQRLLPIVAVGVAALAAVLLVARGLGGGSTASAQQVLDRAIKEEPKSGSLSARVAFSLENNGQTVAPVDTIVAGPASDTAPGKPSKELHFTEQAPGGQKITYDELSTGDRGYIQVDGRWYQLSDAQYKRVFSPDKGQSLVQSLGFDPRRWISDPKLEATANVGGVEANHVSGSVDGEAVFRDLGFYEGNTGDPAASRFVETVKTATKHGTIDVFAGKQDGILRKISVSAQADPVTGGPATKSTLTFALGLDKVNQPVKVDAPEGALPASRIATIPRSKLGSQADDVFGTPSASSTKSGSARKRHAPAAKAHHKRQRSGKSYLSCVQGAENLAALDRCQALLP